MVQENATGVQVVRAFGREKFEMDRFCQKNKITVGEFVAFASYNTTLVWPSVFREMGAWIVDPAQNMEKFTR